MSYKCDNCGIDEHEFDFWCDFCHDLMHECKKVKNGYNSEDICIKCLKEKKSKCIHWYSDCEMKIIDNVERTTCNFCNQVAKEKQIKQKFHRWHDVPFPYYC